MPSLWLYVLPDMHFKSCNNNPVCCGDSKNNSLQTRHPGRLKKWWKGKTLEFLFPALRLECKGEHNHSSPPLTLLIYLKKKNEGQLIQTPKNVVPRVVIYMSPRSTFIPLPSLCRKGVYTLVCNVGRQNHTSEFSFCVVAFLLLQANIFVSVFSFHLCQFIAVNLQKVEDDFSINPYIVNYLWYPACLFTCIPSYTCMILAPFQVVNTRLCEGNTSERMKFGCLFTVVFSAMFKNNSLMLLGKVI